MYYPLTVAGIFFLTRFEFVFTFLDGTQLDPPQIKKLSKQQENSFRKLQKHLLSIQYVHIFD